jgi:hypothetical protein
MQPYSNNILVKGYMDKLGRGRSNGADKMMET